MSLHRNWRRQWHRVLERARPLAASGLAASRLGVRALAWEKARPEPTHKENAAQRDKRSRETIIDAVPSDVVAASTGNGARAGVRAMPRPAIKWIGPGARIALRSFDFAADADAVCAFQEETYTRNFPEFAFSREFAQAFRHDLRRSSLDPNHALFVLDDGRIVGFLWLVVCENNWTGERYGYINNIYLSPNYRAQGLADELMAQSDAFFRNRRIRRVRLTVTASNQSAIGLYERNGYETTRWEMEKEL